MVGGLIFWQVFKSNNCPSGGAVLPRDGGWWLQGTQSGAAAKPGLLLLQMVAAARQGPQELQLGTEGLPGAAENQRSTATEEFSLQSQLRLSHRDREAD